MKQYNSQEIFDIAKRYLHKQIDVIPIVVDLEKSQGNTIVDAFSGKRYLDCISYLASNPIGHNHPKMFDSDFEKRLLRAARSKPSNSDYLTIEMASFIETFAKIAAGEKFPHLFFVEGGTLAVENALKIAFDWKIRKNFAQGINSERGTKVVHFHQAFHGRSGYALSMTNTADPNKTKLFPKFEWPRIVNPKLRFPITPSIERETLEVEIQAEKEIREAFNKYEDDIAAIIIEPIQGEGGDNHFRPEFHKKLRALADEFDVMLIYDEVQAGFGITGKFWAHEHYDITPDIVCFGKKSQVCGVMAGKKVDEVLDNVFVVPSRINSTWGGNLVDMVRSEQYLRIVQEERLTENSAEVGREFLIELLKLSEKYSDKISNVRGRGLMIALDVPDKSAREKLINKCFDLGLLILKCGSTSLRFRPALTLSRSEVGEICNVFEKALKSV